MEERYFLETLRCYGTLCTAVVVGVTSESLSLHFGLVRLLSITGASAIFWRLEGLELLEGRTGKYVPVTSLIALAITFSPDIFQVQSRVW